MYINNKWCGCSSRWKNLEKSHELNSLAIRAAQFPVFFVRLSRFYEVRNDNFASLWISRIFYPYNSYSSKTETSTYNKTFMHPSLNLLLFVITEFPLPLKTLIWRNIWNCFFTNEIISTKIAISHLLHFYDTTKKGAIKLRSTSDIFLPLSKPSPLADQLFFVLMWNNAWIYYIEHVY